MKTLAVRLEKIEASGLAIARWLAEREEVELVLHPALADCPGHELWTRDFTGSAGVFSVVLKSGVSKQQVYSFVNSLELFKIGYSWGGVASLAVAYDFTNYKGRPHYQHRIVRLNIGLEETGDLLNDLDRALDLMKRSG
jgi:cystathionine beta-lyase